MSTITNLYHAYPPRCQVEHILDKLDISKKFLFFITCIPELVSAAKFGSLNKVFSFKFLHHKMSYAKQNNLEFIIIFEEVFEAPCYDDIKDLVNAISIETNIPTNEMIIMSGAQHQKNAPIKNCDVLCIIGFDNLFDGTNIYFDPSHHFISLARYSRMHRVLVTKEIWNRELDKFGYCSLGCTENDVLPEEEIKKILGNFSNRYPSILDTIVKGIDDQNSFNDVRIGGAFLNVALETSYEFEVNQNFWSVPFWTEKSSKPFAWGQVPLILGPMNNLNIFRQFNFDLFEDIIDTSYDKESNPYKRIQLYVDQIEKICAWPLQKCIEYKKQNIHRFEYNRKLFEEIYQIKSFDYNYKSASAALGVSIKKQI